MITIQRRRMSLDRVKLLLTLVIGGERVLFVPSKAGNLQNYFASFIHHSNDVILRMSLLQLFLIYAPFRINHIMSRNRFDSILCALRFTNREVPYEDSFPQMRQLEEARNQNTARQFLAIVDQCS